jgi:hypothetical protein
VYSFVVLYSEHKKLFALEGAEPLWEYRGWGAAEQRWAPTTRQEMLESLSPQRWAAWISWPSVLLERGT